MTEKNNEETPKTENIEVSSQETVTAPVKAAKKLPKAVLPCAIIGGIALVVIIALVAVRAVMSTPKKVFTNAINGVYKEVSNTLQESKDAYNPSKNAFKVDLSLKADTNIDLKNMLGLKSDIDLSKLELNATVGVDVPNKEALIGGSIKGSSETIDLNFLYKEAKAYIKTSLYDKVLEYEDEDTDIFGEADQIADELEEINYDPELYDDILKAVTDSLTESLDEDAMSKESAEIKIAGKEKKVTKYSYELNQKNIKKLLKNTIKELEDDDDFVKDLAKALGVDEDEIKETLDDAKESAENYSSEVKITLNVYTSGLLNKIIGFDVKSGDFKATYYTNGDNLDSQISYSGVSIAFTIEDGKVKLTAAGETLLTAKADSFTNEKIDLKDIDFELNDEKIENIIKNIAKKIASSSDYIDEEDIEDSIEDMMDELGFENLDIKVTGSLYGTADESKIDLDVSFGVEVDGDEYKAASSVYYTAKKEDQKTSGEYKIKGEYNDQWIELSGDYSVVISDELETFNVKDAVKLDDLDETEGEKIVNNLEEIIKKDEVFNSIYEEVKSMLNTTDMYDTEDTTTDIDEDYDFDTTWDYEE